MADQPLGNQIEERLSEAVDSGSLPDSVHERATQLLGRLRQPVRLGILGRPGSGKSSLLNFLVGREILTEDVKLPTVQVSYGERAGATCTLSDGSKKELYTAAARDIAELKPVFVEIVMPSPSLKKISVLEVVTPNDPNAIHRASQWAAKRCDLAFWCTQSFDDNEQAIWAQMPDVLKDHAFLMLTRADVLARSRTLQQTLEATRAIAQDEFNHILPIATHDAIAARRLNGTVNKERMRSSGGLALINAVMKHIELGQQSYVDMADMLLQQHAPQTAPAETIPEEEDIDATQAVTEAAQTAAPEPTPEPEVEVEAEPVAIEEPQQETAAPTTEAEVEVEPEVEAEVESEVEAKVEVAAPAAPNVVALQPATRDAYEHVLQYVAERSRALVDLAAELGDAAPSQIMAETVEHVQWLSDYLNEHGDDGDEALVRARDTAMDAADLVQLMQMEKRDSAAIEAVTLLLQIKHELQADLAA